MPDGFGFVGWELAGRPGLQPGRYVVRRYAGDAAQHVVVIGGHTAPGRRGAVRRWRAATTEAVPVEVVRAAVVGAVPLPDPEAWLRSAGDDQVTAALVVLNASLHAARIAAADPYLVELGAGRALITRVGYGTGEEVAEGHWTRARELRPATRRVAREAALRPQERFGALLAARDVALACELLVLRARLDLDHGRAREAALQLEAALRAAIAELAGWRELAGMAARLDELAGLEPGVASTAASARAGGLDDEARATVAHALARLEATLRARTAGATF